MGAALAVAVAPPRLAVRTLSYYRRIVPSLVLVPLGLAALGGFFLWRVRVERGRVLETPFQRFARGLRLLQIALGEALLAVAEATARAMRDLVESYRRAVEEVES